MGYKCNQSSSTLKNEVTNKSVSNSLNSSRVCRGRGRKEPESILHFFKRYLPLQDDSPEPSSSTDYEISIENVNKHVGCTDGEVAPSLAYREHERAHKIRTTISTNESSTPASPSSNLSHSHYLIRQSICLYAASSVILALCYLTTPTSASTDAASHSV
jgi:hypothetical protein